MFIRPTDAELRINGEPDAQVVPHASKAKAGELQETRSVYGSEMAARSYSSTPSTSVTTEDVMTNTYRMAARVKKKIRLLFAKSDTCFRLHCIKMMQSGYQRQEKLRDVF